MTGSSPRSRTAPSPSAFPTGPTRRRVSTMPLKASPGRTESRSPFCTPRSSGLSKNGATLGKSLVFRSDHELTKSKDGGANGLNDRVLRAGRPVPLGPGALRNRHGGQAEDYASARRTHLQRAHPPPAVHDPAPPQDPRRRGTAGRVLEDHVRLQRAHDDRLSP